MSFPLWNMFWHQAKILKKYYFFVLLFLSHITETHVPDPLYQNSFRARLLIWYLNHMRHGKHFDEKICERIKSSQVHYFFIKNVPLLFTSLHFAWSNCYALLHINCKRNTNILLSDSFLTELLRGDILNCFRYEFILTCLFTYISLLYS